ncbi:MAG: hypothetical protein EA421_16605 [Gemmatimonadales bacterium]|nr:MAG: hypothetical protein EA421_16605 [Gemmatimonadales bacterium]
MSVPSPRPSSRNTPRFLALMGMVALAPTLMGCASESPIPGPSGGEGALLPDLATFTGLPAAPRASASSAFWDHWGDGRAELSGYRVTIPRYGAPREGEMALIYVTEPHDRRSWIKDDDATSPHRVEVLKLIRSFQFLTGIYPYSVFSSVFSPVDRWGGEPFHPVRIHLDVQEWCGSVSHRVWPAQDRLRSLRLSYFASEGETLREVALPEGTLFEEALLIQLRELDGPFHEGGDWEGWLVRELWSLRTGHGPVEPVRARISRSSATRGAVPVTRFQIEAEGYQRTIDVEEAAPRRILGWETSTGEVAELLTTERLAYWSLNRLGDEGVREELGLSPEGFLPPGGGSACALPEADSEPPEARTGG